MDKKEKRKRIFIVISSVLGLIVLALALMFTDFGIPCPTKTMFNFDCAGCGTTRMLRAALRLDFYQAIRYNAATFFLIPLIILYYVFQAVAYINGTKNKLYEITPNWVYIVIIVLLVLFGILRNVPMFSFLAPTEV